MGTFAANLFEMDGSKDSRGSWFVKGIELSQFKVGIQLVMV